MQRSIYFCLAILAVLAFQPIQAQQVYLPVSSESETAVKLYQEATDARYNYNWDQMWERFNKAIEEDPDFFMAYFRAAMVNWGWQNKQYFDENYSKAMACKGELNKTEKICRQILMALKENPDAGLCSFGKLLAEAAPEVLEAYFWQGGLCNSAGDLEAAIAAYEKAESLNPELWGIQGLLGSAYKDANQMDKAEVVFDNMIQQIPDSPGPYFNMGNLLMATGEYAEAEEMFRKSFQMAEGFRPAHRKAELMAAMQVAARETESFLRRDYDAWAACYRQSSIVYFAYTDKNNTWQYRGWEELSKGVKEMFRENPDPIEGEVTRSNFLFGVSDNVVRVTYDQTVGDNTTMELRVLVKVDGEYQITMMNAIGNSSYE